MKYEDLKQKLLTHKPKFILLACFIIIFLVGYGTGKKGASQIQNKTPAKNYNTKSVITPKPEAGEPQVKNNQLTTEKENQTPAEPKAEVAGTQASKSEKTPCVVKGNISSTGSKIYHIKGGAFYERTNPEQCFLTENEAVSAGYRKSSR